MTRCPLCGLVVYAGVCGCYSEWDGQDGEYTRDDEPPEVLRECAAEGGLPHEILGRFIRKLIDLKALIPET